MDSGQPPPPGNPWAPPPPPGGQAPPGLYSALFAARPGVIPLRPLRLGDVLDGALQVVRRYPAATIGSAVIVAALSGLAQVLAQLVLLSTPEVPGIGTAVIAVVALLVTITASALLAGVIVTPVERGILGQRATFGESWRRALARVAPLVGFTLIIGTASALIVTALVVPVVLLGLLSEWFYLLFIVTFLAIPVGLLAGYVKVMLGAPAIIVENRGPIQALRRSWQLSRGRFWPLLGTVVLIGVIMYFVGMVISIPTSVFSVLFMVGSVNASTGGPPLAYYAINSVGGIIAGAITYPFSAAAISLLYYDQRIRTEGLDVELARLAAER